MPSTSHNYKINMPHRHTISYEGPEGKINFEVEPAQNGLILYTNLGTRCQLTLKEQEKITTRVKKWMKIKFNKPNFQIIEDTTPPQ